LSKPKSSLLQRVISAAVLLPTVLFLLFRGGWWFFGLILVMMTLATWEYVRMLRRLAYHPLYVFAILMVWAILTSFYLSESYLQPAIAFVLFASLSWHILRDHTSTRVENWLLPLAGALYIGWTGGHFLLLRALPQGAYRLFTTLGITWLADTGAYFIGKAWGKHRMAPRLSPKKTWEGLIGGVVVALISGPILFRLFGFDWWHGAILGLLLSTLTPLGDIGVSMIKRQAGVKDSGNLIPGHGGAFDRVDSLLITVILGYYYHVWVIGASSLA
jgi:phosphatidate cytidylyltransferase